ncbi:hypothetical protein ACFWBN_36205 [Streptomyces sp. NPDC059989]|uniref:hypothetical protein n=1 Tax=Streptomyces sp. NPDC059989 TaxID=3347026 RepID=UPI003690C680
MKARAGTRIAAVTLMAVMTLTGCGTDSGGVSPTGGGGDALGGTAKQRENREAHGKKVHSAAEEVKTALADAGITTQVLATPLGGGSVVGAHPEDTAVAAFTQGFENLVQRGDWQAQSGGSNPAVFSAKKKDGCMAIGVHDFTDRRPETKPGEVMVTISVICPVSQETQGRS